MVIKLALLSIGASSIHFAVAADHFEYHWTHGAFFLAVGVGQFSWAALVLAVPSRRWFKLGIAGNGLVISAWLASRTVGAPFGTRPWEPEPLSVQDGLATGFEVILVFMLLARLTRAAGATSTPTPSLGRFFSFGVLVCLLSGGAILAATGGGLHHGESEGASLLAGHQHSGTLVSSADPLLADIKIRVETSGTGAGLDLLAQASAADPEVQALAHQYVHAIGRYVYKKTDDPALAFSSCDERFESGCFHGVLQGYFEEHPSLTGGGIAKLCSGPIKLEPLTNLHFQCLHGLGHGLSLFFDHDLVTALGYCDFLVSNWERDSCYGGAFMENIIWEQSASSQGQRLSGGAIIKEDPHFPCSAVDAGYKEACYMMQSSVFLHLNGHDFASAFAECETAPDSLIGVCYRSMGRDIVGYTLHDPVESLKLCLLGERERLGECAFGAVQTLINVEGSTDAAMAFCLAVPQDGKGSCYAGLGEFLFSLYPEPESRAEQCARISIHRWVRVCKSAAFLLRLPA